MAFRFAMRDKLGREASPQLFETIENEFERLWAALKAVNDEGGSADSSVDLSDYVKGPTPASSVDAELALWSGTTGRLLKRGTGTGFVKVTSGVASVQALIDLTDEVTGLLPLANLALDGDATHVLFGDGTMRALVRADISDFAHRLLSAQHSDTEPETPEPGALIVGVSTGDTVDSELFWLDGQPVAIVSGLDDTGADDYWLDGAPVAPVGFSSEGQWAKLDPSPDLDVVVKWNGTSFEWAPYGGGTGDGDVVGPASSTDDALVAFDGTTGKLLKETTIGQWSNYTAAWSSASDPQPAIGNGSIFAEYTVIGKTCHFRVVVNMGSTTTFGTGAWKFSLPVAANATVGIIGNAFAFDSGTINRTGSSILMDANSCSGIIDSSGNSFTPFVPFTWANGDRAEVGGTYRTA
jgi:hypothetical protein